MDPFTIALYIGFFILNELIRPKPKIENQRPAGLGDFDFPTATEGRSVPLVWGTVQIEGPNVVWYGDLVQTPIKERIKTSLFSSKTIIKGFKYNVGIQFALARGTVGELLGVDIGDTEVFSGSVTHGNVAAINKPTLFGGDDLGSGGVVGNLRFHSGSLSQAVSGYLANFRLASASIAAFGTGTGYTAGDVLTLVGGTFTTPAKIQVAAVLSGAISAFFILEQGVYSVKPTNPVSVTGGTGSGALFDLTFAGQFQSIGGDTPAYRGTCYCMWEGGYIGNSTSIKPWKFRVRRIVTGPATGANESINSGNDCNPVNVIYEIMTNTDWGLGIPAGDIDTSNFSAAGVTLKSENNGFSMLLDNALEAIDMIRELERQVDGVVFFDQASSKWKINLARGGYDVNSLLELTPANVVELVNFSRGAWEDTTNQVRVEFNDRTDNYKQTFSLAQDMANVRLQNGVNVSVTQRFPGIKDRTLANTVAWRSLRTLSYPLAKASLIVDRKFYSVQPFQVLALTDPDLGFTKLPMRVSSIDFGELEDNKIRLELVQDIFFFQLGSFGDPATSSWVPPSDSLLPFDPDKQIAFEAPRGFVIRDPDSDGISDKIWAGARRKGPEVSFQIVERHSAGTPSGSFSLAGEGFSLLLLGRLNSSLAAGTATPTSTLILSSTPDTQAALEAAFPDGGTVADIGTNLVGLILVDNEMMLPNGAQTSGANVQLNNVYRGVLDTVQSAHSAGAYVWLLFVGGTLTESTFTPTHNVDVKLLPRTTSNLVSESLATTIAIAMANRVRRPYPPSLVKLGGTSWASTISLEQTGSGGETYGFLVDLNRRDFRTVDEIAALLSDAAAIFADFPAANSTTQQLDVRNDPAGANTLLYSISGNGPQFTVLRIDVLLATDGVLPTTLRLAMRGSHTYEGVTYTSRYDLNWDFAATSGLTGQFNFGALDTNEDSFNYTVTVAGVNAFTLSSAFTAGDVEYRVNAGAWTTLISAGNTTGNTASLSISDVLEVRHTSSDVGAKKFLTMNAAGAGQDAYAVLYV